jgi:Bacterial Ig domain/Bacterial cadherin-like domain/Matrixin
MMTLNDLNLPSQTVAVVSRADAPASSTVTRVMGICQPVQYLPSGELPGPGEGGSLPNHWARDYFQMYEGRAVELPPLRSVEIVRQPKHGKVVIAKNSADTELMQYIPDADYLGQDRIEYRVNIDGQPVRLVYFVHVTKKYLDDTPVTYFCRDNTWKISDDGLNPDSSFASDYGAWLRLARLAAVIGDASSVLSGFQSLDGAALGETTGLGKEATMTLDTTAAGHGWFIDQTPLDNSEFLPTADPTIFKAKAGSAAADKMDMLSVLLHEYGHALGLEHSVDSRDFMAASLQPGERRLPTADELSLMARLVAQLKVADGSLPQPLDHSPDNTPLAPTQRAGSVQRVGRRSGSSGSDDATGPQYEGAVNSTLTNGDFGADGTAGWVSEGSVQINGAVATLNESADRQTHLAQGFIVNPGSRLLTFTLADRALRRNSADAPGDAFEVALLNANSGLPVAGTVSLTHSDALLNIQTDGTEHLASGIRKMTNADGSATYYVDLPQSLADTPVLLSFDLLGFGATQSHVSLRDIRIVRDPQANADSAVGDEDTALSGNLLANDLMLGTTARIELVTGPTHGRVALALDGSFNYQPAADYFGPDSFSYRFVEADGATSNTATVDLTVRPVNDAPSLIAGPSLEVIAGRPVNFNPLATASDVDSAALTVELLTAPAHGSLVRQPTAA